MRKPLRRPGPWSSAALFLATVFSLCAAPLSTLAAAGPAPPALGGSGADCCCPATPPVASCCEEPVDEALPCLAQESGCGCRAPSDPRPADPAPSPAEGAEGVLRKLVEKLRIAGTLPSVVMDGAELHRPEQVAGGTAPPGRDVSHGVLQRRAARGTIAVLAVLSVSRI